MPFPLHAVSAEFFGQFGGTVLGSSVEPLAPEPDDDVPFLGATVTVAFDNAGIFGDDRADVYDDVYPRYRALRTEWWRTLANTATADDEPALQPNLHPLSQPGAPVGPPLPARSRPSREVEVVPLDTVPRSPYVDRMRRQYGLEFGIRSSGGRLLDLAEGLLLAVRAATDALHEIDSFVDLGSGTGAASGLVLRRSRPKHAFVHDDSYIAARHLNEHLGPLAIETGTNLQVVTGDCRAVEFAQPVDLLAIGLPFAQQPSLLARSGPAIKAALGHDGVLVAATSTVGMRFYQALIDGDDPRLAAWPWYVRGASLPDLFPVGATVRVRNLVISIASASASRVDATVAGMVARGAEILT